MYNRQGFCLKLIEEERIARRLIMRGRQNVCLRQSLSSVDLHDQLGAPAFFLFSLLHVLKLL